MMSTRWCFSVALLLAASSPATAARTGSDCLVLDQALREARTDFGTLRRKGIGGARCVHQKRELNCAWGFSSDRYGEAETQVERLKRCTAAQPGAARLTANRRESAFQLNPETAVFITGPDADSGNWKIQLRITTTADWD